MQLNLDNNDKDGSSFYIALYRISVAEHQKAMAIEVTPLICQNTWTRVSRGKLTNDKNGYKRTIIKGI